MLLNVKKLSTPLWNVWRLQSYFCVHSKRGDSARSTHPPTSWILRLSVAPHVLAAVIQTRAPAIVERARDAGSCRGSARKPGGARTRPRGRAEKVRPASSGFHGVLSTAGSDVSGAGCEQGRGPTAPHDSSSCRARGTQQYFTCRITQAERVANLVTAQPSSCVQRCVRLAARVHKRAL